MNTVRPWLIRAMVAAYEPRRRRIVGELHRMDDHSRCGWLPPAVFVTGQVWVDLHTMTLRDGLPPVERMHELDRQRFA